MHLRNSLWITLAVGITLMLAACAAPPAPAPAGTAPATAGKAGEVVQQEASALSGTEWQLESFFDGTKAIPPVPGNVPTLGFGLDRYTGFGGCDWFMGIYSIKGAAGSLNIEAPARTTGGCVNQPNALEQQGTYLTMLQNVTNYAVENGKLVFYTTGQQRMMSMTALASVPFEGTPWEVSFYYSPSTNIWVPALAGAPITARFDGKTLAGNAGCNDYTAQYERNGDRLKLGPVAVTNKTCASPEGVMNQEQGYLALLQTVGSMQQYPRSIQLFASSQAPLLMYHATSAAPQ